MSKVLRCCRALCLHEREREPGVGAGDELAIEAEVDAGVECGAPVGAGIDYLDIIDGIGDIVVDVLVVGLGGELEGSVVGAEGIVAAEDDLVATLTADVVVHADHGVAFGVEVGLAIFLIERGLVIET